MSGVAGARRVAATPLAAELGARINAERKRRGVSVAAVSAAVGKIPEMVYRWEGGAGRPSLDDMLALSALFGRSTHWLLTGAEFRP